MKKKKFSLYQDDKLEIELSEFFSDKLYRNDLETILQKYFPKNSYF